MLGFSRQKSTGDIPVWQADGDDMQLVQGGMALSYGSLAVGTVIPAGTPVVFSEANRTASVLHTGYLQADAANTDVTYKLKKGHTFLIGDYLAVTVGAKAYAITAIDTSNAAYDLLTVGTTLGAVITAGTTLFASTATGATAAALPAINGLLYQETTVNPGADVGVVIRGTCYARRVPYNSDIAAVAALKQIIYSQSF